MLTLYTKERLSRPNLSIVEELQEYTEQKQSALDILKTLKPEEFLLEEEDSDSDDIFDPFSDLKDNFDKKLEIAKKKLSNFEKNLQLMESFSDDFKKAMEETRKELKLDSKIYYEDMDEITSTLENFKLPENISKSIEDKINEILADKDNLNCGPDLDIPDPNPGGNTPETDTETTDYDVMSGVWNMLKTSKDMIASPPFFNALRQQEPHWLDTVGAEWETVEEAREKCVNWLTNQDEN